MATTEKNWTYYRGDTFKSANVAVTENSVAKDITGYTITHTWRKYNIDGLLLRTATIGTGITVTNPTGGLFTIDAFDQSWPVGDMHHDVKLISPTGDVETIIIGILKIIADVLNTP